MPDNKNNKDEKVQEILNRDPAEEGRKAIEAGNKINDKDKPADLAEKDKREDAEKWK